MSATQQPLLIRPATEQDAPELLSIYAPYVENTAITFEYTVPGLEEFAGRIRRTLEKYPYLTALQDGQAVGYAYASPFKERAAYDWSVETSIYVRAGLHGQGIGSRLYDALETCLQAQHIQNANACITYPNPESIGFHQKRGYKMAAHFTACGYKLGRWHDMVWMEKLLGSHDGAPKPFLPFPQALPRVKADGRFL